MPEVKKARPVSALLYRDPQFFNEAKASGEVARLLGAKPDQDPAQLGYAGCQGGIFVKRALAGQESLGERFFDWSPVPDSPHYAQEGKLKPAGEIKEIVAGREFRDKAGVELESIPLRILVNVEKYRAAVAG